MRRLTLVLPLLLAGCGAPHSAPTSPLLGTWTWTAVDPRTENVLGAGKLQLNGLDGAAATGRYTDPGRGGPGTARLGPLTSALDVRLSADGATAPLLEATDEDGKLSEVDGRATFEGYGVIRGPSGEVRVYVFAHQMSVGK